MSSVAILGLGKMGSAIAKELVAAGHQVKGWNRNTTVSEKLSSEINSSLFSIAISPKEALTDADIAITLFTDGQVTQEILLKDPETLENSNPSIIIVDMGTSGVQAALNLHEGISKAGRRFIDAPVSGSVATIQAHQLLVMASGKSSDIEEVTSVLMVFSKKVAHVGNIGAGQTMKISVNLVVHSLNAAVSEGLALAESFGISREDAYSIYEESVIAAPFVKYKKAAYLDPKWPVAMRIDTVVKDLGLITDFARSQGIDLKAGEAVQMLYSGAVAAGFGAEDMSALAQYVTKK